MPFSPPQGSESFIQDVQLRTQHLVDTGIWDIPQERFTGWFQQFISQEEKFFGACLLDSLIYRSREQFLACATALYRGALRWQCGAQVPGNSDIDLLSFLKSPIDRKIRLIPVIGDDDPPTKSGPLVLRYIKRELRLDETWMDWPWKVERLVSSAAASVFIFVDDFLGSGEQFNSFVKSQKIPINAPATRWIYAPVVAHRRGIAGVQADFPNIEIVAAEYLDDSHDFFSTATWDGLPSGSVTASDALDFYNEFLSRRGIDLQGNRPLGFNGLGLCFGFSHSTPDNALPILWVDNQSWSGLLKR
ncbi:MAG: hypothetical protein AABM64_09360 [Pseudomonadota bacterium]